VQLLRNLSKGIKINVLKLKKINHDDKKMILTLPR
jgi:hypothetical protein